ncbi:MAG: MarR family transcriptional regulator [Calditrichaeota bacterium]|nr:MAG: MarR family transcriptional regulator [Calditrichota bacterium]
MQVPLGRRFAILFRKVKNAISEKLPEAVGRDFPILGVLALLDKPLQQNELAENCFCDTPTLVKVLDKFEKLEFLKRKKSETDRRVNLVHITEKGKKLMPEIFCGVSEVEQMIFNDFTKDEKETFLNLLTKIEVNLKDFEPKTDKYIEEKMEKLKQLNLKATKRC